MVSDTILTPKSVFLTRRNASLRLKNTTGSIYSVYILPDAVVLRPLDVVVALLIRGHVQLRAAVARGSPRLRAQNPADPSADHSGFCRMPWSFAHSTWW